MARKKTDKAEAKKPEPEILEPETGGEEKKQPVGFRYKPRRAKLHVADTINGKPLLDIIGDMASKGLKKKEAASIVGVHYFTFLDFLNANPEAMDAWEDGRQQGKAAFRRTGYRHAMYDPSTWRFLAKQKRGLGLGMTDGTESREQLDSSSPRRMSKEEAVARILELSDKLAQTPNKVHGGLPAPSGR